MSVYVVATARIDNPEMLNEYLGKVVATFPPDARILAVDETAEVVEGDVQPPRIVLIEFPSRESFRGWYDSPAYQAIVGLRLESTTGTLVVAEGFTPPA
jgi:uncharacterized protein (DUF1330 family)